MTPYLEPFSASYELAGGVEIYTHHDAEAEMDADLFSTLASMFGDSFIGLVGGLHYQFKPEDRIPANSIAVPADNHDDPSALLIQK